MPAQPSSAIWPHSSREKPTGSFASRSLRSSFTGACSVTNSRAVLRKSSCSSVKASDIEAPFVE